MKFFRSVLVRLLSVAAFARPPSNEPKPSRIWITNVTIVSPENLADLARGSVLIENEHVACLGRKANAKPPAGTTVISGEGGFLIPGLIDSHVRVTVTPGVGFGEGDRKSQMVKAYLKQVPRSYLYYGYTTLIDLGVGVDHAAMDDFRHSPLHPDLYSCGDALALLNGYPMVFFPVAERFKLFPNFIYDPQQVSSIPLNISHKTTLLLRMWHE